MAVVFLRQMWFLWSVKALKEIESSVDSFVRDTVKCSRLVSSYEQQSTVTTVLICVWQMGRMHALDVELEVLQKQMEAALRLSEDKSLAKSVRRKHRQNYHDTHRKVSLCLYFKDFFLFLALVCWNWTSFRPCFCGKFDVYDGEFFHIRWMTSLN